MLKDFDKVNTDGIKVVSNFHTHNYLCGHAYGTVIDYVRVAIEHNYKVLGVSDHFSSHRSTDLAYMRFDKLQQEYLPQFDEAKALYGDKIDILKGVEVAYYDGDDKYYERLKNCLDYVVMGQHGYTLNGRYKNSFFDGNDEQNVVAYCKHSIQGLKTGLFTVFAHPDVIFYSNPTLTDGMRRAFDEMIKVAVDCGVIVELNSNGIRNANFTYPTDLLVDCCKKSNATVVVSADCHSPTELYDEYVVKLYAYAKQHGLKLIDDIRNK